MEHVLNREIEMAAYESSKARACFNLGIIGPGDLGRQSAIKVIDLEAQLPRAVGKVVLFGTNEEPGSLAVEQIYQATATTKEISFCHVSKLRKHMDSTDIFLITADANQMHRYAETSSPRPNKMVLMRNNIPLIQSIASHFDSDYDGTVIIATNLTDIAALVFMHQSGIDPSRIVGLNQIDAIRFRERIRELFRGEALIEADPCTSTPKVFVVGPHHDPYCVFSSGFCSGLGVARSLFMDAQGNRTELAEQINTFVKTSGRTHTEVLKHTNAQTARAVLETLQAVLGEQASVTASAYLQEEAVFVGAPVLFRDGRAMIAPLELSAEEWSAYESRVRDLPRFIEDMFTNLTNGHRKGGSSSESQSSAAALAR